jgi:hypothetical protein
MLQIFATMFFSLAALGAATLLSEMLIDNMGDVKRALGLGADAGRAVRPAPMRFRPARTARPARMPAWRAAA